MNALFYHPSALAAGSNFMGAFTAPANLRITSAALEATGGSQSSVALRVGAASVATLTLRDAPGWRVVRQPELDIAVPSGETVSMIVASAPSDISLAPILASCTVTWGRE